MVKRTLDIEAEEIEQQAASGLKVGHEVIVNLDPEGKPKFQGSDGSVVAAVPEEKYHKLPPTSRKGSIRSIRRDNTGQRILHLLIRLDITAHSPQSQAGQAVALQEEDNFLPEYLPDGVLTQLAESEEIKRLLSDTRLQRLILSIDHDRSPEQALKVALEGPEFRVVADKILQVKGPGTSAEQPEDQSPRAKTSADTQQGVDQQGNAFSFWGVASALADSVKKTTADLSASVKETDWRAEIEAFGKGVAEDASEVQRHAREGASRLEENAAKARMPQVHPEKFKAHIDQVGNTLGQFGTRMLAGSKDMFEQVSEAVQAELDAIEGRVTQPKHGATSKGSRQNAAGGPKYNRLEAEISAMQRNSSTYCDQPKDAQDFADWLHAFELRSKEGEIEAITKSNAFMSELQSRIVPLIVQYEVFWTRYFYQLDKLKQRHEQRQSVAQLAAQTPAEQPAWDDEDEEGGPKSQQPATQGQERGDESPAASEQQEAEQPPPQLPPKRLAQLKGGEHEDEPDTSTASEEDSSNAPWTVVTSPSHKREGSVEAISRPSPVPEEAADQISLPQGAKAGDTRATKDNPENQAAEESPDGTTPSEEDDMTIELSDEEAGPEAAEGGSEAEEDWGLWD